MSAGNGSHFSREGGAWVGAGAEPGRASFTLWHVSAEL